MNDLYNLYEGEFISTLREINDIIFNAQTNPKNYDISSINEKTRYAEKQLKLMTTEVGGISLSEGRLKLDLQILIEKHRAVFKETLEKIRYIQSNKENFINYNEKDVHDQNDRLLKNNKMLSDGVENLKYAKKTAFEAENMAVNINVNLHKQTEILEKNITKAKDTNENLNLANRLINEINRKRITNKLIFYCIGMVVFIGLAVVIYYEIEED